jgi:hypothetical protein
MFRVQSRERSSSLVAWTNGSHVQVGPLLQIRLKKSPNAQVRMLIYEFARGKLRSDLYQQFQEADWSGIQQRVLELEAAIEQVELGFANRAPLLSYVSEPTLSGGTQGVSKHGNLALRPDTRKTASLTEYNAWPSDLITNVLDGLPARGGFFTPARSNKQAHSKFWWHIQLAIAALLGVVIYATIDGAAVIGSLLGLQPRAEATNTVAANSPGPQGSVLLIGKPVSATPARSRSPDFPLPSEFGAYAVSNGQLTELGLLPVRVPDQRIAISSSISAPGRTHLPAGPVQFVIFRRDLVNSAPDRVNVRVVAQVVRALRFDPSGKASVSNVEHVWIVRSNSYQMRVAPVADHPEMILIRPDADVTLSAGRYALVLKGVAYDFTVDGPLTDPAHCLERTDALNARVYKECRNL